MESWSNQGMDYRTAWRQWPLNAADVKRVFLNLITQQISLNGFMTSFLNMVLSGFCRVESKVKWKDRIPLFEIGQGQKTKVSFLFEN